MSQSWTTLADEIRGLHQRLDHLDCALPQRGRAGSALLIAATAVVLALIVWNWPAALRAQAQPDIQEVVCNSLKISTPEGAERLSLGHDKISGFVKVMGLDGKMRAGFWTDDKSRFGQLDLLNENDKSLITLFGTKTGGGITIQDGASRKQAYVGTAANREGGIITLYGPNGRSLVHLGHDSEGGNVFINGHDGKARASLWVAKGGKHGLLNLHDESGAERVWLTGDEQGGLIELIAGNNQRQILLDCNAQFGGALRLLSATGKSVFHAGTSANNTHGALTLSSSNGTPHVELFVEPNGDGSVQGRNAAGQVMRTLK